MVRTVKEPHVRRQEIVAMATKMFLENEYQKTSLNEIVAALGVAKGTVYHYFKSKEDLLDAVVSEMAEGFRQTVHAQMGASKGSAVEDLKNLIQAMNVEESIGDTLKQLHRPGNVLLHIRLLAAFVRGLAPIMANVLERGCKEGVFFVRNPLESSELLLAGLQFITDVGVSPWSKEDVERRRRAFPTLIAAQLGVESL